MRRMETARARMETAPRYCTFCGGGLFPAGHGRPPTMRLTCARCGRITYRNPAVGVAVIIATAHTVLLGRRARGPYAGRWCIPCGYVEWNEDIRDAARREMREETGLEVDVGDVCAVHSNFHDRARQTVGVWFFGTARGGVMQPGDDLDRLGHYPIKYPPALAFPTDALVLERLRERRGRS
jgi:ADP-ribose pyrophosphatase YjhB (NUDIX family)